jgi:hypothetical protein
MIVKQIPSPSLSQTPSTSPTFQMLKASLTSPAYAARAPLSTNISKPFDTKCIKVFTTVSGRHHSIHSLQKSPFFLLLDFIFNAKAGVLVFLEVTFSREKLAHLTSH